MLLLITVFCLWTSGKLCKHTHGHGHTHTRAHKDAAELWPRWSGLLYIIFLNTPHTHPCALNWARFTGWAPASLSGFGETQKVTAKLCGKTLWGSQRSVEQMFSFFPPSFFSRLVHHCPDRFLHFSGQHYWKSCLVAVWDLSSSGHIFNIVNWWVSVYIYATAHPRIHHSGDGGVFLELSSGGKQNCRRSKITSKWWLLLQTRKKQKNNFELWHKHSLFFSLFLVQL